MFDLVFISCHFIQNLHQKLNNKVLFIIVSDKSFEIQMFNTGFFEGQ